MKNGQLVFAKGTRIESSQMGMLASLGLKQCQTYRRVKVAIFSTGDEVQLPGTTLKEDSIYDSNRYTLHGMLKQLGCEIVDLGILDDNEKSMTQALEKSASDCDLVITSGGVSVGDADFIKQAMETLGKIDFWRINMRPGRPLAFGQIGSVPFFGLPGNPVASWSPLSILSSQLFESSKENKDGKAQK